MLPQRQNNPLAPAVFNGLSSIGYDSQGRAYQDKYLPKSYTVTLTAGQSLSNQIVQFDKNADFIWTGVSIQGTGQPFSIRFTDSTGYRISDAFIGSFAFTATTGIGAPFILPKPLFLPAGSAVIIDFLEQSGVTNGPIEVLFLGSKRFYSANPTEIAYKQRVNNVVDGWALNSALYPNPYYYQWLCVGAMDAVRAANNYRPKIYAIPDQTAIPARANPITSNDEAPGMQPFSDYITQVRMLPGTIVLGMSLTVLVYVGGAPGVYQAITFQQPNNFYVNCTDDATGIPFFSNWMTELMFNVPCLWQGDGLLPPLINQVDYVAKTSWLPLTRPRPVLNPGVVTVTMCHKSNVGNYNINPQLLLMCAEPCNAIRAQEECV